MLLLTMNSDDARRTGPAGQDEGKAGARRGQKRESTQLLPDLEEKVTSTVPVASGSTPIQGGSGSSTDVLVNSTVATSVSVQDMVQTSVSYFYE